MRPYGVVGQVEPIQANIRDEASTRRGDRRRRRGDQLRRHPRRGRAADLRGADGRGRRRGSPGSPPRRASGGSSTSRRSAPTPDSDSGYAAAKGRGEAAVRAAFPGAVILRPSIVFGTEDAVLQPLRARWRGCRRCCRWSAPTPGSSRSTSTTSPRRRRPRRPAAPRPASTSSAGRRSRRFRELMQRMLAIIRRRRLVVALPCWLARLVGRRPRLRVAADAAGWSPAAADPRPGPAARAATTWSRRARAGFAELGVDADADGGGARELSLRLPAGRPVYRDPGIGRCGLRT